MLNLLRSASFVVGLVGVSLLTGCATSVFPGGPSVAGGLYTDVTDPAQHLAVSTDAASGAKRGEASAMAILGLVGIGDAGLNAAMKEGGITKVHHVDHKVMGVLGFLYVQTTTIVYGE